MRSSRAFGLDKAAHIAATVLYGVVDELHQATVPGRDASSLDLLADALGAVLGVTIMNYDRL